MLFTKKQLVIPHTNHAFVWGLFYSLFGKRLSYTLKSIGVYKRLYLKMYKNFLKNWELIGGLVRHKKSIWLGKIVPIVLICSKFLINFRIKNGDFRHNIWIVYMDSFH